MFVRVFAPFLDLSNLRIEPSLSPTEGEIVTLWPFQSRKPAQSQRGQVQCTLQWTLEQCWWWPFQTRKVRNRGRLGRVWWGGHLPPYQRGADCILNQFLNVGTWWEETVRWASQIAVCTKCGRFDGRCPPWLKIGDQLLFWLLSAFLHPATLLLSS